MKRIKTWTVFGLLTALGIAAFAPASVLADSRQDNKNFWRNGTIAGAAAAIYGLHNRDTTTTVIGAAGAAYAAHRYEQDRHSQDEAKRARARRALYHRNYGYSYGTPARYYGSQTARTRRYYHTTSYSRPRYSSYVRSRSSRVRHRRVCHCS